MVTEKTFEISVDLGVHMDYKIRTMEKTDYDEVYALWTTIHGFALKSVDDSKEAVERFIDRNPGLSVVAVSEGKIVGAMLVGHDGRRGCLYHVCVDENYRKHGIGKAMASEALLRLKEEGITKAQLLAFKGNKVGNSFWQAEQWEQREDVYIYDFVLNEENIIKFNS